MRSIAAVVVLVILGGCGHPDPVAVLFERQINVINQKPGSPSVLLPSRVPTDGLTFHASGGPTRRGYALDIAAAPDCHQATACFVASFTADRGGRLSGKQFRLADGDPAVYRDMSCGASCAPAGIEFVHDGVLYSIQSKLTDSSKRALTALANDAVASGPR